MLFLSVLLVVIENQQRYDVAIGDVVRLKLYVHEKFCFVYPGLSRNLL